MPSLPHRFNRTIPIFASTLIIALSGTAHGQDALGTGNALDANTGQRGSTNYQRPSFTNELNFRNAIATGNAPGGLSFRGDLGYRAAGEFSGVLGSDSLFAFRRDSLYSGLAGMGIRGTDAIQYQFALTTGSTPPKNLMGNLSLARDNYYNPSYSSGTSSRNSATSSGIGFDQDAADLDLRGKQLSPSIIESNALSGFNSSSMLGSLRSTSTYMTTSNLQPALISLYSLGIDRKPIGLIASPLLGITSMPMAQDDPLATNPLVARPANANSDPNTPGGLGSTKLASSYDELVAQMRKHVEEMREINALSGVSTIKPDESNDSWLIRQMQDLREKLYGVKPANDDDPNALPGDPDSIDPANPSDPTDPSQNKTPDVFDPTNDPDSPLSKAIEDALGGIQTDPTGIELYDPTAMAIDPETLEVLRGAAANEIENLFDPGADQRDIFAEHMLAGQRLIAQGRYFEAEERFTHALSIQPGNIPSQLGRFHAQIGAGMVLSASVNLQSLFSMHPELIASRYTGNLLPNPTRIETLLIRLKERAGITNPERSTRVTESNQIRVSSALLLAYIAYQVDDQESLESGLALMKEIGTDTDRRFSSLLSQLWLENEDTGTDTDSDSPGASDAD